MIRYHRFRQTGRKVGEAPEGPGGEGVAIIKAGHSLLGGMAKVEWRGIGGGGGVELP